MTFTSPVSFAEWDSARVPDVGAAVYAVWDGGRLVHVGASGTEVEAGLPRRLRRSGLPGRLQAHTEGDRHDDAFSVSLTQAVVIPSMSRMEMGGFCAGTVSLDRRTRQYVRDHLSYSYAVCESADAAQQLLARARAGEVFDQTPMLEPHAPTR